MDAYKYIVGTSGYSFRDWVGPFYPPGTAGGEMLSRYVEHFRTVEVNFTYYRMPAADTLARMADRTPDGFDFWIKANQQITHEQNRSPAAEFLDALRPMRDRGKLAGVLLQFPQSFHRTVENRRFLADVIDDFQAVPRAVEFRHRSWQSPATLRGLQERETALVVPDVPDLRDLFHSEAVITSSIGYLRLHSRDAGKWYAGPAERYDYSYSKEELRAILGEWSGVQGAAEKVYTFFNNCHAGQAAENAELFRRLLGQIP